jgi:hypothetical protein
LRDGNVEATDANHLDVQLEEIDLLQANE